MQQHTRYLPATNFSLSPSLLSFATNSSCISSNFFPTASLERVLGSHQYPVRFSSVSRHQNCLPEVSGNMQVAEPRPTCQRPLTGRSSSGWCADRLSSLAFQGALGPGLLPPHCLLFIVQISKCWRIQYSFQSLLSPVYTYCLSVLSQHISCVDNPASFIHSFSSATQLCPTLCDPMDCSTSGFPVHHQLPEFSQTHVH